jgi:hypothetical protein
MPASASASVPASVPVSVPVSVPATAKVRKGSIHVVVQPWGDVWIDAKPWGRAPVKARLPQGKHLIEAGYKLRTQKKVVRVKAGTRQEVEFTLSE